MTLGNMRELGVHHLIAFCLNDARLPAIKEAPPWRTHRWLTIGSGSMLIAWPRIRKLLCLL
jgi:hypothetical protein